MSHHKHYIHIFTEVLMHLRTLTCASGLYRNAFAISIHKDLHCTTLAHARISLLGIGIQPLVWNDNKIPNVIEVNTLS